MYEELVKRLREKASKEYDWYNLDEADFYKKAADAIEELQQTAKHYKGCSDDWYKEACDYKAMLPRWIPVTERLPEEYIPVLVCFDFKGRKSVDVAELWSDGGFHNYSDEYLTPEGRNHRKGTHWQPLPEPPKEKV